MADQPTCGRRQQRQRAGFSLVELMTVVIIIGILSAVAIPTFTSYVYKSRTAEATEFLGVIKLREESYRAEFGAYCQVAGAQTTDLVDANFTPSLPVSSPWTVRDPRPFANSSTGITGNWNQLGARPAGMVRFGYAVIAGPPTALPNDALGGKFGYETNPDFWFIAQAVGDLDGDGNFVTFEEYSASRSFWIGGPDNAGSKGWE
ncbi:MAG TPA: prepilin-type N-terminal cleavage/methylation domain-containing protein [Polyangiales bacterium]